MDGGIVPIDTTKSSNIVPMYCMYEKEENIDGQHGYSSASI